DGNSRTCVLCRSLPGNNENSGPYDAPDAQGDQIPRTKQPAQMPLFTRAILQKVLKRLFVK
ncbi:MAG: hypothetical protein ACLQDI_03155, partial [Syntrophobacteraceae bacterium]